MNPMLSKELRQLAAPFGIVLAVAVAATAAVGNQAIEVAEPSFGGNDELRVLGAGFALAGATLGWHQFASERNRATESYLVHRDGGHAAAFRAKFVAAWIAFAIGIAALAVTFFARTWLLDVAAPVARWDSLGSAIWTACVIVPAHAAGVFTAQLRGSAATRTLGFFATAGGSLVLALLASRRFGDSGAASLGVYLPVLALTTWMWLALARRMFAEGDDPDLGYRKSLSLTSAGLVLLLAVPLVENVVSSYQRGLGTALEARRPVIVADPERRVLLAARDERGWRAVDPASGEFVGAELTGFRGRLFDQESPYALLHAHAATPLEWHGPAGDPSRLRVRDDAFSFAGSWQHLVLEGRGEWSAWIGSRDREVVAYRRSDDRLERVELARPDGRPFSERTAIVYGAGKEGSAGFLVDLADSTAWRFDASGARPVLEPLALPDGDRIVGVEQLQSISRARIGAFEPFGYSDRLAVRGERGLYVAVGEGLSSWTSGSVYVAPDDFDRHVEYRVTRVGGDRIAPLVAVTDAHDGRELLRHEFAPRGAVELMLTAAIRGLGLLRSPLVTGAGLALDDGTVRSAWLEWALHAARPWWFLHLGCVLLFAYDVHRRLAGAAFGTRVFWLAAALLGGLMGWAAFHALERRGHAEPARRDELAARVPLLVTA
ncbi:MAG: hypothetical protein L6Q99_03750 [Planctomycetes bacterium]|nr:hypothetical protein [Planctomycetota bacterium]